MQGGHKQQQQLGAGTEYDATLQHRLPPRLGSLHVKHRRKEARASEMRDDKNSKVLHLERGGRGLQRKAGAVHPSEWGARTAGGAAAAALGLAAARGRVGYFGFPLIIA